MTTVDQERESLTKEVQTAVRHSAVYGVGNVLIKALGFLMLPFYTHYLNPRDYGVLEILDLSMSMFGMFLNMGMTAALLRCYAAAPTPEEKRKAVSTAFLFIGATGIVTFLIGFKLISPVSTLLVGPDVPSKCLLLSFTSFVLSYIANLPRTYLRALEASGTFILVDTGALFLTLLLNIVFIAVFKMGLFGILWSSVIIAGLQMVLLSGWTLRKVGMGFSRPLLGQMMRFGLPLIFSNLALFTLNFADRFFLQHLRSLETVGIYAIAYRFGFMMSFLLVQPFYVMWQTRMFVIHARPDYAKVFSQIFVFYSLLLTYAGLALAMLSPEIVRLMVDRKFSSSQDIIPIIALSYVIYGAGYYVQLGMFLANKTNLIAIVSAAAAILNLGLNYVLISRYGIMGAAWATLISFGAIAAGSYWFSQRAFPLPLGIARVAGATAIAVVLYLLSRFWRPESMAVALAGKSFLLVIFPLLLWKTRVLSHAEIGTLLSARHNVLSGISRAFGGGVRKAA